MIWYVDIEHEKAITDPERAADFTRIRSYRAQVCAETSGLPCEAILYQNVSWDLAKKKGLRAIAISGNTTDWAEYDWNTFEPLFEMIRSGQFPTIGFCGGHQLLGLMYNALCGPIRKLEPGEDDKGGFAPSWFKEVGFLPVQVIKNDPIFSGLGRQPRFFESHYWEIKEVPLGFYLLACTDAVRIQCIKHERLPIYGTQFHPEASSAEYPDGFKLLRNFFQLACG